VTNEQCVQFNKWWTEEKGKTNNMGVFTTTAFLGKYDVSVSLRGKSTKTSFTLTKDGGACVIRLD